MKVGVTRSEFVRLSDAYGDAYDAPLVAIADSVRKRAFLTAFDLQVVCKWKSPRPLPLVRSNAESEVEEVTRWALATSSERFRIESLLLLRGVGWPMASVILHWFHREPYPILDVRALWSLDIAMPSNYNFTFWSHYVSQCRLLSESLQLPMRTIDRALWQYSNDAGGPGTAA